ncbi:MAG: amidase [Dehalococcoidia bacterium]
MDRIIHASATDLAHAINLKEVSAREVVQAHLDHIARHNAKINAVVTLDAERALARALEADAATARGERWGPLHGVPITLKDTLETAGLRTTSGFEPLSDNLPANDASAVARLKGAGAILLGKTNTPTLAMDFQTHNPIFGRTNNPWDVARATGGSSGGSAAAIAAGFSALELGTDIGGSVRIPAHSCGVVSLKTTEHRVPMTGHIAVAPGQPRGIRHMDTIGPIGRSLDDLELALRLISGPDGHDWEVAPPAFTHTHHRELRDLRLRWADDLGAVSPDAATKATLRSLAGHLERAGAHVGELRPGVIDQNRALQAWRKLISVEINASNPPEQEERRSMDPSVVGATYRLHAALLAERDFALAAVEALLADADALLLPVCITPAIAHAKTGDPIEVEGKLLDYWLVGTAYTGPFNLTGSPVVVLPAGRSPEGLPIGVQIVGRKWHEVELLAVARAIQEITGPVAVPPGFGA